MSSTYNFLQIKLLKLFYTVSLCIVCTNIWGNNPASHFLTITVNSICNSTNVVYNWPTELSDTNDWLYG